MQSNICPPLWMPRLMLQLSALISPFYPNPFIQLSRLCHPPLYTQATQATRWESREILLYWATHPPLFRAAGWAAHADCRTKTHRNSRTCQPTSRGQPYRDARAAPVRCPRAAAAAAPPRRCLVRLKEVGQLSQAPLVQLPVLQHG